MADDLRKLQLEELDMVRIFKKICEEYKFRYFILGGTLLGAVRHNGFIPWDDDVDIAMPRSDYNKLRSIMNKYNTDEYCFVNFDIDSSYSYAWARMTSKKIKVINHMANIPRVEPVFIDIIPLDGFPDNIIMRQIQKIRLNFWWVLNQICQFDKMVDQKRNRSVISRICVKIAGKFKWIGNHISYKKCLENLNKTLERYPYDSSTKNIINFLAAYGFDEIFPRDAFKSSISYQFENVELQGPQDFDSVCRIIYGDYMTLPPEEDRNKHHIEIIIGEE